MKINDKIPTCPICKKEIGLPVWVLTEFGERFKAYCHDCKRAYLAFEIRWVSEKITNSIRAR